MFDLASLYASPFGQALAASAPRRSPLSLADLYQPLAVPSLPTPPHLAGGVDDLPEADQKKARWQGLLALAAALGQAHAGNTGGALASGALGMQAAGDEAVKGRRAEQVQDYNVAREQAAVEAQNRQAAGQELARRQNAQALFSTYGAIQDMVGDRDPALMARAQAAARTGDHEGLQKLLALAPTRLAELSHGVAPDDPIAAEQAAAARALQAKVTEKQTLAPVDLAVKTAQETALNPILAARAGGEAQAKLPSELAVANARIAAEAANRQPQLHLDTTTGMVVDLTHGTQRPVQGFAAHGSDITEAELQKRIAAEADDLYRAYEKDTAAQRDLYERAARGRAQYDKSFHLPWSSPPPDPGPPPPTATQNRARADADAAAHYANIPRRGVPPAAGAPGVPSLPPGSPAGPAAHVDAAPGPARSIVEKKVRAKMPGASEDQIKAATDLAMKLAGGK